MKLSSLQSSYQPLRRHDAREQRHVRNFPQTDYHFQATAEAVATSRRSRVKAWRSDLRAFRKISSDFMAAETRRGYFAEAAVLALVSGLVAWSLISLLIVLAQTARG
ncbi:MAG: hypothetical protein ABLT11_11530 [Candidatus Acidiferrum sp.]